VYNKENLTKLKPMDSLAPEVMKAFGIVDMAAVADETIPVKFSHEAAWNCSVDWQLPTCGAESSNLLARAVSCGASQTTKATQITDWKEYAPDKCKADRRRFHSDAKTGNDPQAH
jgi:hypothetical protein